MRSGKRPTRRWLATITAVALAITGTALAVTAAGPATAAAAFPLKVSANHRYLTGADNQPFYFAADTGWFMLENATEAEWDLYLDNRRAKGFTAVMVMAPHHWTEPNRYGELPFSPAGNLGSPNERWWARMDTFVSKAAARGLAVNMAVAWLGYHGEEWGVQLANNTVAASRSFGEFVGRRYGTGTRPNVIFSVGGDANPGANLEKLNAIGAGIRAVNPTIPVTVHTAPGNEGRPIYPNSTWVNLNSVYTYYPEKGSGARHVYAMSKDAYLRSPAMPFVQIESGYEGDGATVRQVRAQMYWPVLSGSTGFAYGNRDIWPVSDPTYGRGGQSWLNHLNDAGAVAAGHAARVMMSRPWHNLAPDFNHTVLTAGYGTFNNDRTLGGNDYVTAARTGDGGLVMAYLPSTGTGTRSVTVDMTKLTVNPVSAKWFNPANGTYTTIGSYANTNRAQVFTSPGNNGSGLNDWLLILEGGTGTPTTSSPPTSLPPTGYQTLTAAHSGKVAQVAAGSANGAPVTQNTLTGGTNQQWQVRDAGSGYVNLVNRATGLCMDVLGRSLADGAAVGQYTCGTGTNQQWQLRDAGSGYVTVVARHSGKCLDVLNRSTTDGAATGQWTCGTGTTNQQWRRTAA